MGTIFKGCVFLRSQFNDTWINSIYTLSINIIREYIY